MTKGERGASMGNWLAAEELAPRCVVVHELSATVPDYSLRRATIGSTPAARRAGITDASRAASASSSVATASITGSQGLTPNSWPVISLPAPIAAGMPIANPIPTYEKAPRSTIFTTLPRSAPNAMRTPISPVRCSTI
jgi:hypothetical protein